MKLNIPTQREEREVWYRYYEVLYSRGCDEWGDPLPGVGRIAVELMEIPVLKRTPCGAWVGYCESDKKFVNLNWNKRYALPTIAEARASYRARKRREISLMEGRAAVARRARKRREISLMEGRAAVARRALEAAESQWSKE